MNPNFSDKAKRDFTLIQEAKEGNQKAYTELLGIYHDSLYFLMLKMTGNEQDAEDLTIEAFEKAFRNLSSYSPSFAFSTWLFKVATNNCIDFLRTRKIKESQSLSIDASQNGNDEDNYKKITIIEESLNPEEKVIQSQKRELLNMLIAKLPEDYRNILNLRHFKGLAYSEIAEELQIPIGTVKARLFRSRDLLQSILKEHEIKRDRF